MKVIFDIDDDHRWLRDELEQHAEKALSEVASGGRPEHAAGYLRAIDELSSAIESRYDYHVRKGGPQVIEGDEGAARMSAARKRTKNA